MGRKGRALVAAAIMASAVSLAAQPGGAADTNTQFTISSTGSLAVSAPASANLGSVPSGSLTVQGALGTVTVDDTRALAVATWTTTVSSTDFTSGGATVAKANVGYLTGTPTGSTGFVPGAALTLAAPGVAGAFVGTGNNSVSWNPTITVTLPPGQLAGTYTGVITHSVA